MEPKPLFGNASSPSADNGRGFEPRPLSFGAESEPTEVVSAATKKEPGALLFGEEPRAEPKLGLPSRTEKTPGAIDFGASTESSPVVQPTAASEPMQPRALQLPERSVTPVVVSTSAPGKPVFSSEAHPAQSAAEAAVKRLEPGLFDAYEPRIRRFIASLLPVTVARLQDYADSALRSSQQLTLEVAALTNAFSRLGSAELLAEAVQVCSLKNGFLDKLRAKFSNPENMRPKLEALEKELQKVSRSLVDLLPRNDEQARSLVLHLVALRGVEQIASAPSTSPELQLLVQRLDMLRAAGQQAQLVGVQLRQLQITVGTLETQCEHMLNVTLSAVILATAGSRTS